MFNRILLAAALLVGWSLAAGAQTAVKHVVVPRASASSGHEMFVSYCATCHGVDGRGAGPTASSLKVSPPDLALLSKKNDGKFPAAHVATVLRNGVESSAHGSKEMPIWGPILRQTSHGQEGELQMRLTNLNKYIESLQVK